jgi:hypothetical protein
MGLESTPRDLESNGWCFIPPALATAPADILAALGPLLPFRRNGSIHHDLKPYRRDLAPRASMSAITGTDEQPMHTDAAYYPRPPRYIALQCIEPGEAPCPTHVWILDVGSLRRDRPAILAEPNWIAHGGGHTPFYCAMMDVQRGEVRVRFDPLSMRPRSGANQTVAEAEESLGRYTRRVDFHWKRGSLLIIDNWRCLHARGKGADKAPSRCLRRWSIGVGDGLVG